jgi:hypothetical protein
VVGGGGGGGGGKNKDDKDSRGGGAKKSIEMFQVEHVNDEVLGAVTLKMNPLADRSNRLKFARERNARAGDAKASGVEVELVVVTGE